MARFAALLASMLLSFACLAGCNGQSSQQVLPRSGPFTLTDVKGHTVTDRTLSGRPYAMFFGFTRCPDVCPTTMARMAALYKAMGPDRDRLSILFVSVDPDHDKPRDIEAFLSLFDAPVVGLTGTPRQLQDLEKNFGIYVEKVPLPGGDYTIDHTAGVLLIDRDGQFVEMLDTNAPPSASIAQLRRLIRG